MEQEILLSISILVSGREDTTDKCLDSLEQLRSRVGSELILTDTGCTPQQRGRLEPRADKYLTFQWCDDFAAARNVGLREASGKWFLYMDDDEWFEDTSEIEEFFLSGEYLKYNSAHYKVRNYANPEGTIWLDSYLSRMVRMTPETRFQYPIHEALFPSDYPIKHLGSFVHHFGYAFSDPEKELAKRKRNLSLLLPSIEREPRCLRHYLQTMVEYAAMEDYEKAVKTAYEGIRNHDPARTDNDKYLQVLYAGAIRHLVNWGRYEEACSEADRFIQLPDICALAVATICGDVSYAYLRRKDYARGLTCIRCYLELKAGFDANPDVYLEQQTMLLETCYEKSHYRWVMGTALALASALETVAAPKKVSAADLREAESLFRNISFDELRESIRYWCGQVAKNDVEELERNFCGAWKKTDDLYGQAAANEIRRCCLMKTSGTVQDFATLQKKIRNMAENVVSLNQSLYKPEMVKRFPELLPGEYRAALLLAHPDEDGSEELKQWKEAARLWPELSDVLSDCARLLKKELAEHKLQEQEKESEQAEFRMLAAQLKSRVRGMMENGEYKAALETIRQMKGLLPEDEELIFLESRIRSFL